MRRIIVILLAILSLLLHAQAQLKDENLMVTMPEGYKVGFENKKNNQLMTEMVPSGETVKDSVRNADGAGVFRHEGCDAGAIQAASSEDVGRELRACAIQSGGADDRARLSDDGVDPVVPAEQGNRQA